MHNAARATTVPTKANDAAEHLYYPAANGYVFATNGLSVRQHMPFYGMVLIAIDGQPIRVISEGTVIEHNALALWAKDVTFAAPRTPFVSIAVNPLHPLFRAFVAMPAPRALRLEHARYAHSSKLMIRAVQGAMSHQEVLSLFDEVLRISREALPSIRPLDSRAQALTTLLWENPRCTLDEIASHLNLSYHHTSHLFTKTVGLPVRSYQLWQKLYRAGAPLMAGASLTDTAHAAGFVDSAHYSRAFQTAFGRCPTHMFKTRRTTVFFNNAFREVPRFEAAVKR